LWLAALVLVGRRMQTLGRAAVERVA